MSDRRCPCEFGVGMNIILNEYRIPDKGTFEIRQRVTLAISGEQARKLVNRFLLMEVSRSATSPSACWNISATNVAKMEREP